MKTVEKDPEGGWIARDPNTGETIGGDDWRWNCRESARDVVWQAKHLPERDADQVRIDGEEMQHG